MKRKKKVLLVIFAILKLFVLVLVVTAFIYAGKKAYTFGYRVFAEEAMSNPPGKKVVVTITDDITVDELAELLKSKRLIRDEKVFRVQYQLSEYRGKLKGGNYILNTSQTAEEMLEELSGEDETENGQETEPESGTEPESADE